MNFMIIEEGFGSEIHARPLARAIKSLGYEVHYHQWIHPVFRKTDNLFTYILHALYRVDARFSLGPLTLFSNLYVCILLIIKRPQFLFVYRGRTILPQTLQIAKFLGCNPLGYNNDDPFSQSYNDKYWAVYKASMKYYCHIFAYRKSNQRVYQENSISSSMLLPYYSSQHIFATKGSEHFSCDVIFVGHFENDGRDKILLELLEAGINLKIYGPNWNKSRLKSRLEELLNYEIVPIALRDYNLALNSAKLGIVFLSKLNNDNYTRRCFEIPVTNAVMLAPYSTELDDKFKENVHALYYRSANTLKEDIAKILKNTDLLTRINIQARSVVVKDGHSELDRAKLIIETAKAMN